MFNKFLGVFGTKELGRFIFLRKKAKKLPN